MSHPKAFISYAWESQQVKDWVKELATRLRSDGVDAKLDQWELALGDQMTHFMEKSVRENDYVLIICTPKYKEKSNERIGGVGYEGDVMTAEVLQRSNDRKFIPILKSGTNETSIPSWLQGKYYVDLSDESYFDSNYSDLKTTLLSLREKAPTLGDRETKVPLSSSTEIGEKASISGSKKIGGPVSSRVENASGQASKNEPIRIKGIVIDEVTYPRHDGTPGSALYKIPFELSEVPGDEWKELFVSTWNRPPRFSQMHRPGIASVHKSRIILDGTTIEEVERYHKDTLKLVLDVVNQKLKEMATEKETREQNHRNTKEKHLKNIDDVSKRIDFS